MTIMGIVLLIIGALLFIASFIVSGKDKDSAASSKAMGLKLDRMIDERVEEVKGRLQDVAGIVREEEESKAQRELERLTNEKIMAIDDYSRAVLEEIEKNHKEAMFLYDMLDNKTSDVKNTIRKADALKMEQESAQKAPKETAPKEPAPPAPSSQEQFIKDREESSEAMRDLLYGGEDKPLGMTGMDRLKSAAGIPTEDGASENGDELISSDFETGTESQDPEFSRNDRVLELKKTGMDNVEIAKSLNMGVGEVNLITDLFSESEES